MNITNYEKGYLRELAMQIKEISNSEENKKKIQRWRDNNNLKEGVKPLFMNHYWPVAMNEIFGDNYYNCTSQDALFFEKKFLTKLYYINDLKDDTVCEPVVSAQGAGYIEEFGGMKREIKRAKDDDGSGAYEIVPNIFEPEDIEKFTPPILHYNKEKAYENFMQTQELFDGILTAVRAPLTAGTKTADEYSWYRGMENTYTDIYDDPDWMKEGLQKIADNIMQRNKLVEEAGIFGNFDLSDPLGASCGLNYADGIDDWRSVKNGDYFNYKIPLKNAWTASIAEVFTCVSNQAHEEFSFAFDKKVVEEFKYVNVGCCEVLDKKIDLIRKYFKNARKISISEWCDYETAAAAIKRDFVYSYKPAGTVFLKEHLDREATEKEIRGVLEAVKKHGCNAELVLNIGGAFGKNPREKALEWSKMTRQLINEYYD